MEMTGEYLVAADRQTVWDALNNPEILSKAIPGCEQIDRLNDTELEATAVASVGPVKAKFKGKVTLSDLDPPRSYRLSGEGKGGPAGFAKGGAVVTLEEREDATLLRYEVTASVGGKIAQIGQRLIDSAAKKIADEFFANLSEIVGGRAQQVEQPFGVAGEFQAASVPSTPSVHEEKGLAPLVWITGLTIFIALLVFLALQLPSQ